MTTLVRLLEIDRSLLDFEDEHGLAVAERLWVEGGMPAEPSQLCAILEKILRRLVEEGIGYPRILLKRKKQLDRQEWKPRMLSPSAQSGPKASGNGCPHCRGTGLRVAPGGMSASLCPCEAWKKTTAATRATGHE